MRSKIILIALLLSVLPAQASDVVSVRELQDFMHGYYPYSSKGPVELTLFPPSVEHLGSNEVKFTFDGIAIRGSGGARYSGITASIQGKLARSGGFLLFKNVDYISLDATNVDYEYRGDVEGSIYRMLTSHYIERPILQIRNTRFDERVLPRFRLEEVKVVGGG